MLSQDLPRQLLLPLRNSGKRERSTWLQFCSQCLIEDEQPYFRRRWRLASRIACAEHNCRLRDRCPSCCGRLAGFEQRELVPQHYCARCGYDLRRASTIAISPGARWFDRCIDDICRLKAPEGYQPGLLLFRRLLVLPSLVDMFAPRLLTSLSTAARTRCVERLTRRLSDWLSDTEASTLKRRRYLVSDAESFGALIELLSAALARKTGRPSAANRGEPIFDSAKLFRGYELTSGQIWSGRL